MTTTRIINDENAFEKYRSEWFINVECKKPYESIGCSLVYSADASSFFEYTQNPMSYYTICPRCYGKNFYNKNNIPAFVQNIVENDQLVKSAGKSI
jgi:hypothetical protein